MTSLSEQLSAVRQSQWEAQLDVFQTLTNRAIDSAEQLIALNMRTSRASVEQATGTVQQLLRMTDPRDLLAIGSQTQGQWQQLFSYSRELLGIAAGNRLRTWSNLTPTLPAAAPVPLLAAPAAPAVAPEAAPAIAPSMEPVTSLMEQASIAVAGSATVSGEIASAAADTGAALAEATLSAAAPAVAKTADAVQEAGQALADAAPHPAAGEATQAETPAPAPAPAAPEAPDAQPTELEAEKTGASESETPDAPAKPAEPAESTAAEPAPQPSAAFTMQSAILPADEVVARTSDDVAFQAEALIEAAIADETPTAKAKPVAKALNKLAPKPASAEHPIASAAVLQASEHVELPIVTPPDATPPVHLSNGPAPAERRRSARKK